MKKLIFTLLLLQTGFNLTAQQREKLKEKNFNSSKFEPYTLAVDARKYEKLPIHFSSLLFMDARADMSKAGFVRSGDANTFHNFVFPEPLDGYFTRQMNKAVVQDSAATETLFLSINNFWLSQIIVKASLEVDLLH